MQIGTRVFQFLPTGKKFGTVMYNSPSRPRTPVWIIWDNENPLNEMERYTLRKSGYWIKVGRSGGDSGARTECWNVIAPVASEELAEAI